MRENSSDLDYHEGFNSSRDRNVRNRASGTDWTRERGTSDRLYNPSGPAGSSGSVISSTWQIRNPKYSRTIISLSLIFATLGILLTIIELARSAGG